MIEGDFFAHQDRLKAELGRESLAKRAATSYSELDAMARTLLPFLGKNESGVSDDKFGSTSDSRDGVLSKFLHGEKPPAVAAAVSKAAQEEADNLKILERTRRGVLTASHDAPLNKSAIQSKMHSILAKLSGDCVGDELSRLQGAIECQDMSLFLEISEPILERLKAAA